MGMEGTAGGKPDSKVWENAREVRDGREGNRFASQGASAPMGTTRMPSGRR